MTGKIIYLKERDISLYVRIDGMGSPILLMHGGPGADHTTLFPFLPLAENHQLIFYDHRCNGRSSNPDITTMTWENLVEDAETLRRALGIKNWAVLGHSFGGMVALEYGIRHPEAITHLFIVDSGGAANVVQSNASLELKNRNYNQRVIETAEKFYNGKIREKDLVRSMLILGPAYYSKPGIKLLIREAIHGFKIKRNPAACIYGFNTLLPGWSVMPLLNNISSPTLIIAGEDDFQFPPEHQKDLSDGINNSELCIIKNAGHNAPAEKQKEVLERISGFLKK